ncbi:MAG: DUF808 domain-containing protein [Pseudomonadota bacterium]
MSGLIALLDDVAALAKVAAASLDDVVAQAGKAGAKAAGAVIDDAAVTPKYVQGFEASRELPIVWRIAKGSIKNKLLILLPVALLLASFAPRMIPPLLMLGGAYLCFEGAEKILHVFFPSHHGSEDETGPPVTAAHLEEAKVSGAIKTDFILSAEIMTIALAALPPNSVLFQAVALALVALGITVLVYGSVALIVKADDVGLHLAKEGRFSATRAFGRGIVTWMPTFMKLLTIVGTAAMLWVGGSIILHSLEALGVAGPVYAIHGIASGVAHGLSAAQGFVEWLVTATLDGIFGLLLGLAIVPVITRLTGLLRRA